MNINQQNAAEEKTESVESITFARKLVATLYQTTVNSFVNSQKDDSKSVLENICTFSFSTDKSQFADCNSCGDLLDPSKVTNNLKNSSSQHLSDLSSSNSHLSSCSSHPQINDPLCNLSESTKVQHISTVISNLTVGHLTFKPVSKGNNKTNQFEEWFSPTKGNDKVVKSIRRMNIVQGILVLLVAHALSTCYFNVIAWALMLPITLPMTLVIAIHFCFIIIFGPFYSSTHLLLSFLSFPSYSSSSSLTSHHIKKITPQHSQAKIQFCESLDLSSDSSKNTSTTTSPCSQIMKMANAEKSPFSWRRATANTTNWSVFSTALLYLIVAVCLGSSKYTNLFLFVFFANKLILYFINLKFNHLFKQK